MYNVYHIKSIDFKSVLILHTLQPLYEEQVTSTRLDHLAFKHF